MPNPIADPLTLNLMFLCVVALAAWFPCCAQVDPPPCDSCTADSDTVSVTFSGIDDSICVCSWLNATFVLARTATNSCRWQTTGTFSCGTGGQYTITAEATTIPGITTRRGWRVTVSLAIPSGGIGNTVTYQWKNSSIDPFDCTATRSLTVNSVASLPDLCDTGSWSTSTCTIN